MSQKPVNPYLFLGLLALIWGSSFILMKEGLKHFSSYQVAAMRIGFAGVALIPFVNWRKVVIRSGDLKYFIISGFLGSALPAFLFTAAQTKISSSLAGALNGLTPLFALLVGVLFIGIKVNKLKIYGVICGLLGAFFLVIGKSINFDIGYTSLAVLASLCYGINVNIIKQKLNDYPPLLVAALPLAMISLLGVGVMLYNGFNFDIYNTQHIKSLGAILLLAILGTSLSLVMFNRLIQQTNTVFATSVTYLIPIVALFWGFLAGEDIHWTQLAGLLSILVAIWLIRKDK
ncbi:MAG: drug/metabolite transporter (DMT)-like permease [Bacteroidia bacterium]|jgi:drug/metabolite transporter (DMT)-like permease|tara:strand:+ start:131 stop:994 length:864 start_codon:yes stop_codon:yes gene_type:complete